MFKFSPLSQKMLFDSGGRVSPSVTCCYSPGRIIRRSTWSCDSAHYQPQHPVGFVSWSKEDFLAEVAGKFSECWVAPTVIMLATGGLNISWAIFEPSVASCSISPIFSIAIACSQFLTSISTCMLFLQLFVELHYLNIMVIWCCQGPHFRSHILGKWLLNELLHFDS